MFQPETGGFKEHVMNLTDGSCTHQGSHRVPEPQPQSRHVSYYPTKFLGSWNFTPPEILRPFPEFVVSRIREFDQSEQLFDFAICTNENGPASL